MFIPVSANMRLKPLNNEKAKISIEGMFLGQNKNNLPEVRLKY